MALNTLESQAILDRLEEFKNTRKDAGEDTAALLEAALFVEDVFGISLNDEDICEKNFGTHETMEKFVLKKFRKK